MFVVKDLFVEKFSTEQPQVNQLEVQENFTSCANAVAISVETALKGRKPRESIIFIESQKQLKPTSDEIILVDNDDNDLSVSVNNEMVNGTEEAGVMIECMEVEEDAVEYIGTIEPDTNVNNYVRRSICSSLSDYL